MYVDALFGLMECIMVFVRSELNCCGDLLHSYTVSCRR